MASENSTVQTMYPRRILALFLAYSSYHLAGAPMLRYAGAAEKAFVFLILIFSLIALHGWYSEHRKNFVTQNDITRIVFLLSTIIGFTVFLSQGPIGWDAMGEYGVPGYAGSAINFMSMGGEEDFKNAVPKQLARHSSLLIASAATIGKLTSGSINAFALLSVISCVSIWCSISLTIPGRLLQLACVLFVLSIPLVENSIFILGYYDLFSASLYLFLLVMVRRLVKKAGGLDLVIFAGVCVMLWASKSIGPVFVGISLIVLIYYFFIENKFRLKSVSYRTKLVTAPLLICAMGAIFLAAAAMAFSAGQELPPILFGREIRFANIEMSTLGESIIYSFIYNSSFSLACSLFLIVLLLFFNLMAPDRKFQDLEVAAVFALGAIMALAFLSVSRLTYYGNAISLPGQDTGMSRFHLYFLLPAMLFCFDCISRFSIACGRR